MLISIKYVTSDLLTILSLSAFMLSFHKIFFIDTSNNSFEPRYYFQVSQVVLDICFKTVSNTLARASHDKTENIRLMEKFEKLNALAASMREQGNNEEDIQQVVGSILRLILFVN